ncbi:MAG: SDR family NAD(P)-dependent oxidoreductase [Gammaproteobacteria bacterium]|nr:SDR family NAD(P)-dependent oxidoreductase [Gammaproteobacteria bacterium]
MATEFGHASTTDEVISGVRLDGKTAVVTGGSAGLGVESGRVLAAAGANVVMLGRDAGRLAAAVEGIGAELPAASVSMEIMDLADLASVRAAAERLREACAQIHILLNNAGVMACPLARTKDGFELQFGTNHLGHFLFTCLLLPSLVAAAPARIVNLSSAGHKLGDIDFDDPNFERREYDKWLAYGQSKTANALFSVALNERLAGQGVTANAVHPGMIMTELGRHLEPADIEILQARSGAMDIAFKSVPAGAATSIWACTSAELEGRGGLYLEDCHIAEPVSEANPAGGVAAHAQDRAAAERLWELSEQLVGERFAT